MRRDEIEALGGGSPSAVNSPEVGPCLVEDRPTRALYIFNHLQYDSGTLKEVYDRDASKGEPICRCRATTILATILSKKHRTRWRSHAHLLYGNCISERCTSTTALLFVLEIGPTVRTRARSSLRACLSLREARRPAAAGIQRGEPDTDLPGRARKELRRSERMQMDIPARPPRPCDYCGSLLHVRRNPPSQTGAPVRGLHRPLRRSAPPPWLSARRSKAADESAIPWRATASSRSKAGRATMPSISGEGPDVVPDPRLFGQYQGHDLPLAPILAREPTRDRLRTAPVLRLFGSSAGRRGDRGAGPRSAGGRGGARGETHRSRPKAMGGAVALAWATRHPASLPALVARFLPVPAHGEGILRRLYRLISHPREPLLAVPLLISPHGSHRTHMWHGRIPGGLRDPHQTAARTMREAIGAPLIVRPAACVQCCTQRATLKGKITRCSRTLLTRHHDNCPRSFTGTAALPPFPFRHLRTNPPLRQAPTAHLTALKGYTDHNSQNCRARAVVGL